MRTKREIINRMAQQQEYVADLFRRLDNKQLEEGRFYLLSNSAAEVYSDLEKELQQVRSFSAEALLREALFAFNKIPNTVYSEKSTYWLASKINNYLKNYE